MFIATSVRKVILTKKWDVNDWKIKISKKFNQSKKLRWIIFNWYLTNWALNKHLLAHRHTWNFARGWNFQFQPRLKKIGVTLELSIRGKTNIFYFISPRDEKIFAKICGIFYKNVLRKKTFLMQLHDYIKLWCQISSTRKVRCLILKLLK